MSRPVIGCPQCAAPVPAPGPTDSEVRCGGGHVVPAVAGILDCRSDVAGYDVAADRRRAAELWAHAEDSFEALLRRYWSTQPDVATHLAERFVEGDLIGVERAAQVAAQIVEKVGRAPDDAACVLEVGCGTAALSVALARRSSWVVASDISLAWLVLARRRLEDLGLANVTLVAATGDRLPFEVGTFDLVVAADVIEHVPDAGAMVHGCRRVLRPGGTLWVSTPNRFSLTPEPHVRLWGVGFLPRPLALRYVRRARAVDYGDIHTLSARSLRHALGSSGDRVAVQAPPIADAVRATYGPRARQMIDTYHRARRTVLLRRALMLVAPLFHGTMRKDDHGA